MPTRVWRVAPPAPGTQAPRDPEEAPVMAGATRQGAAPEPLGRRGAPGPEALAHAAQASNPATDSASRRTTPTTAATPPAATHARSEMPKQHATREPAGSGAVQRGSPIATR